MKRFAFILIALAFICGDASAQTPVKHSVKVVATYPHDRTSYTQGLFFDGSQMYESTGEYGNSTFRKVNLQSGQPERKLKFSSKYFLEGSVFFKGKLYLLTWQNSVAFVYNANTLEYEKTVRYPRQGWGLTTDGNHLIASDGTSDLYFMDGDFNVQKTLKVTFNGHAVRLLNELEWIEGRIWANVYTTDTIFIINPTNGVVEEYIDCSGLLPDAFRHPDTDVLNGIAFNSENGKVYLTGKNWPLLFEVVLN